MSKIKIKPHGDIYYIKVETAKAGALDTSSRDSAVEHGEILACGEECTLYKKGDKVFFKAWGMDHTTYKDVRYCFVSEKTRAILCEVDEA
jgi:co-chaperonin GroES (HSP10)